MFEMKKLFLLLEVLYCGQDEIASKQFIKKFHQLTDDKHDIAVKWLRKKVKSLFPLKTFNLHSSCKIYKGTFSYGDTYIGETNYNIEERWSEHISSDNKSELPTHLAENEGHSLLRIILLATPEDSKHTKTCQHSFIPN